MAVLTIDIGNSDITTVVFESNGESAGGERRIAAANHADYGTVIANIPDITAAYISSVAPSANVSVAAAVKRYGVTDVKFIDIPALVAVSNTVVGVTLACDEPRKVGADLVCDCVGAVRRCGAPVFIADYGTVSKFLVVDKDSRYIAASFCPGVKAGMNLFGGAELLAGVTGTEANHSLNTGGSREVKPFGANTADCMLSGVVYGTACAADELYRRCCEIYGCEFKFVVTGGMAGRIAPHCRVPHEREPFLTNYGIYYISEVLQ